LRVGIGHREIFVARIAAVWRFRALLAMLLVTEILARDVTLLTL